MLRWRRVEVSGGALLLWAALFYLDDQGVVLLSLLACVFHELGHYAAIRALGGSVTLLRVTCIGAEMRLSGHRTLGWAAQVVTALAGPAANFATGLAAGRMGTGQGWCFAGLNFALGTFNLLPVSCLDGGRALRCLLIPLLGGLWAGRVLSALSAALAVGLLAADVLLLRCGRFNLTLALVALWLLLGDPAMWGEKRKKYLQSSNDCGKLSWTQ